MSTDIRDVMNRIKNLQEFEIQYTVPDDFGFYGPVPYDMEIVGNQAFVKVWAMSLEEAQGQVETYFNEGCK
jgi:hypothetical protein